MSAADPKKKKNPRRGRLKEGKGDEPAQFEGGTDAAPNAGFDPAEVAEEMKMWWVDGDGDKFLLEMTDTRWSTWSERKVLKRMRCLPGRMIALRPRDGEMVSESDQVLLHTMEHRRLDLAMPGLAGHSAGIYEMNGQRICVRSSPRLVTPAAGKWETTRKLIEGLLGELQAPYFHSWMKVAVEALYLGGPGNFRPGQALIFAGKADAGKGRIQHQVITGLLGGRSADPGPYMFGRSDFNGEMIAAEHLLMEDPVSTTLTKDRVFFGEMIKGIVVNDNHRLHRKREDALTGLPFWRLSISLNDDPDKMRVLPLLTPDTRDKLMIFHVESNPLPMPTTTLAERQAFREAIASELPAYAHWLLEEWKIPKEIQATRFGVKEWHHPSLVTELFEDTPAAELLMLIDAAEFETPSTGKIKLWQLPDPANRDESGKVWKGQAIDLEKILLGEFGAWSSSVAREAKKLFGHNKCARLLGRLREDQPARVDQWRSNSERGWLVALP